jgi:hypothetical protein
MDSDLGQFGWFDLARFWSRVDVLDHDSCWLWRDAVTDQGYGRIKLLGKDRRAHRVAFYLSGGRCTAAAPLVLHSCDTPSCCNPLHLRAGTDAENGADKSERGRVPKHKGERNPAARLTDEQVATIRERFKGQRGQAAALAREFGCSPSNISYIVRGKSRTP